MIVNMPENKREFHVSFGSRDTLNPMGGFSGNSSGLTGRGLSNSHEQSAVNAPTTVEAKNAQSFEFKGFMSWISSLFGSNLKDWSDSNDETSFSFSGCRNPE